MIAASDIQNMNPRERIQAMELLWESLSKIECDLPSPSWHEEVLSHRLAKVDSGQAKFLTLPKLKERLLHTSS